MEAEMQMLSSLDKDRSGRLLCEEGTKELVLRSGVWPAPFTALHYLSFLATGMYDNPHQGEKQRQL